LPLALGVGAEGLHVPVKISVDFITQQRQILLIISLATTEGAIQNRNDALHVVVVAQPGRVY
jgi:hypothetical protein